MSLFPSIHFIFIVCCWSKPIPPWLDLSLCDHLGVCTSAANKTGWEIPGSWDSPHLERGAHSPQCCHTVPGLFLLLSLTRDRTHRAIWASLESQSAAHNGHMRVWEGQRGSMATAVWMQATSIPHFHHDREVNGVPPTLTQGNTKQKITVITTASCLKQSSKACLL